MLGNWQRGLVLKLSCVLCKATLGAGVTPEWLCELMLVRGTAAGGASGGPTDGSSCLRYWTQCPGFVRKNRCVKHVMRS